MTAPPGMFNSLITESMIGDLEKLTPEGGNKYIEDLIKEKLQLVELKNFPKLYSVSKDQNGLGTYKFYNGIEIEIDGIKDGGKGNYESFVRRVIDPLVKTHVITGRGKVELSEIIQKVDKSDTRYDEAFNKLKTEVELNEKKRELLVKQKELVEKYNKDSKEIQSTVWNIDKSAAGVSTNITSSLLDNSYNNNTTHNIKKSTNITDNSVKESHVTIKIENINLILDGNQLNNLYKTDNSINFSKMFGEYLRNQNKYNDEELVDNFKKYIKHNPQTRDYNVYNDTEMKISKDQLIPLAKIFKVGSTGKCIFTDHDFQYTTLEGVKDFVFMEADKVNELLKGVKHKKEVCESVDTESVKHVTINEKDRILKFEGLIDKYPKSRYLYTDYNQYVISIRILYEMISGNSDDMALCKGIFEKDIKDQAGFTKAISTLLKNDNSKYYVNKDSNNARIYGPSRDTILFIKN